MLDLIRARYVSAPVFRGSMLPLQWELDLYDFVLVAGLPKTWKTFRRNIFRNLMMQKTLYQSKKNWSLIIFHKSETFCFSPLAFHRFWVLGFRGLWKCCSPCSGEHVFILIFIFTHFSENIHEHTLLKIVYVRFPLQPQPLFWPTTFKHTLPANLKNLKTWKTWKLDFQAFKFSSFYKC